MKPRGENFVERLVVNGGRRVELALNDNDTPLLVVNNDSINFFVVRAISDVVAGLDWSAKVDVAQVPGKEALAVVGEILRVVGIVVNIAADAFE